VALLLAACGPSVSEVRTAYYPPHEKACALEFVQADMGQLGPGAPWELVGHVIIGEAGTGDPFSEKYRNIVRPRACAMGGDAVAILLATKTQVMLARGSSTDYVVLRHPTAAGEPAPPQKF